MKTVVLITQKLNHDEILLQFLEFWFQLRFANESFHHAQKSIRWRMRRYPFDLTIGDGVCITKSDRYVESTPSREKYLVIITKDANS